MSNGDETQVGGEPPKPSGAEEEGDRRRLWLLGLGVLLVGAIVGVGIALAAGGGNDDSVSSGTATTSTTAATTTTATTPFGGVPPATSTGGGGGGGGNKATTTTKATTPSTTTTTAPSNTPKITSFSTNPNFKACMAGSSFSLTVSWTTENTTQTALSVDGPGVYKTYPMPNASESFTYGCATEQHSFTLTANGPNGQATKTITLNIQEIPM